MDAPLVYARRKKQRVGFRLTLQRRDGDRWVNAKRSEWSVKRATRHVPAPFRARGLKIGLAGFATAWRGKADLRWYGRNGRVLGRATVFPDWYEATEMGASHTQAWHCGGTTG